MRDATAILAAPPPAPPPAGAPWRLALVASPIGNLEDLTFRALRVLREAELIAAEDTRRARILLTHYQITAPLTSLHAFNEHRKVASLLTQVLAGKRVAVLSDAGTPGLADPGYLLVREALTRGVEPLVVPGVSALTYAVVAAGLPVHEFHFAGFLPHKTGRRRAVLTRLASGAGTVFLFESPHRVTRLLEDLAATFGPDARVAILREATKLHEEHRRGSVAELLAATAGQVWRGEVTVAVAPAGAAPAPAPAGEAAAAADAVADTDA